MASQSGKGSPVPVLTKLCLRYVQVDDTEY